MGKEWAPQCTLYPSKNGTPVVTLIHPGAHNFPAEAPELFVKFFKEHAKP
jgi:polyhydroxybutyrate depolymerase